MFKHSSGRLETRFRFLFSVCVCVCFFFFFLLFLSKKDINGVIYGLIYLFSDPNPNDPLNHEAAALYRFFHFLFSFHFFSFFLFSETILLNFNELFNEHFGFFSISFLFFAFFNKPSFLYLSKRRFLQWCFFPSIKIRNKKKGKRNKHLSLKLPLTSFTTQERI